MNQVFYYYLTIPNYTLNSLNYSMYVLVIQNIQYLQPDFWNLTHTRALEEEVPYQVLSIAELVTLLLNPSMPYRKSNESFVYCNQEQDGKYHYSTHKAECPSWAPGSIELADEHRSKNPGCTSRSC